MNTTSDTEASSKLNERVYTTLTSSNGTYGDITER